jgi:hypothetical protein
VNSEAVNIAEIIRAAAQSPLGILALMLMSLYTITLTFFKKASESIKFIIWLCLFAGVVMFASLTVSRVPESSVTTTVSKESVPPNIVSTQDQKNCVESDPSVECILKRKD